MTSRQRRAQTRSDLSSLPHGSKLKNKEGRLYFRQDDVLKPTAPSLDEDNYPVYLLEAATVYALSGERIENLLDVGVEGKVEVRGRLTILPDEAEISHLRTPQRNGQWIAFPCHAFSIGWGPSAIWALGDRKWFEIQPSSEYKSTYAKMTEGVAVYYYFTELYEQLGRSLTKYPIDSIFLLYAELEGNNLTADVIRERVKNHARFLLTQMTKRGENVQWANTGIFKWLVEECKETYAAVLEKTTLTSVTGLSEPQKRAETRIIPPAYSQSYPAPKETSESRASPLSAPTRRQITTQGNPSTTEVIIRTMNELAKDHPVPDRITMSTVCTALYQDLSIELAQAKVIFRCHAAQIFQSLDAGIWANSQVYKDLTEELAVFGSSSQPAKNFARLLEAWPNMSEKSRKTHPLATRAKEFHDYGATAKTITLRPRKPAGYRRRPTKKSSTPNLADNEAARGRGLVSPSSESDSEPRPVRSGKAVPSVLRGKNAILRPSSTSTPPYATDASSSKSINPDHGLPVGVGGRNRKRKAVEPEMGDVSDDETMFDAMDNTVQQDTMDDTIEEEDLDIKLVDIPLPSSDPTGPNGSWVCPKQDCSTVIRDSLSEDGKVSIRRHLYSHADPDVMQYIVETETKKHGGIKTQYLLEKIRQIGANKRMEEEAAKTGTLQTVPPVKRAGV